MLDLERTYLQTAAKRHLAAQAEFEQMDWRSAQPDLTDPRNKGLSKERYEARRQDYLDMSSRAPFATTATDIKILLTKHYKSLTELFSIPQLKGARPTWLPLAPFSVQALALRHQLPRYPGPVSYVDLM